MALRASGDDYEHSAIAQSMRPTGPRAAFRGEWVDQKQAEPFRTIAVSGQVIDIMADALWKRNKDKPPSELHADAMDVNEALNRCGYVISRT